MAKRTVVQRASADVPIAGDSLLFKLNATYLVAPDSSRSDAHLDAACMLEAQQAVIQAIINDSDDAPHLQRLAFAALYQSRQIEGMLVAAGPGEGSVR